MKLEITKEDIDRGIRRDPWRCPVANALKRCIPGEYWQVFLLSGAFAGNVLRFKFPSGAMDFITAFDNYFTVRPTTIELQEASDES